MRTKLGGEQRGPNRADRGKAGPKYHLVVDQQGVPLAANLLAVNVNDSRQLQPLVDAIPPIWRRVREPGRPRRHLAKLHGDKGDDYPVLRRPLGAGVSPHGVTGRQAPYQVSRVLPTIVRLIAHNRPSVSQERRHRESFLRRHWHARDPPARRIPLSTVSVATATHRKEQPAMLALPTTAFEIVTWAQAKVARDCHVQVQSSFYSIPWRYVGQTLDIRITDIHLSRLRRSARFADGIASSTW